MANCGYGSSWVSRGLRALVLEKRLPYALQAPVDHFLKSIGLVRKTVRVGHYAVTLRRCTADAAFVENVLVNEDYFREGYRPKPDDVIVDVGANIGTFVLAAAKYARRGRIIAIEPVPDNLWLLRKNIKQNNLQNVGVISAAVGSSSEVTKLYVAEPGFHSTKFDRGRGFVDVPTVTLPDIFARHNIDTCNLLKIDCEGAEFDFLPTLESSLWRRIERIAMEFSAPVPDWIYGDPTDAQVESKLEFGNLLLELLQRNGFRIDAYIDCKGFRAGYIFAASMNR